MELQEQKTYVIPHNYQENGRILNMFQKEQVKKALIVAVPITVLLFALPIPITAKCFIAVFTIVGPAAIFLFELDQILWDMYTFKQDRHIYTEGGESFVYQMEKQKTWR